MKKTFFTCFTGILLTSTITCVGYSQDLNSIAKLKSWQGKFISSSEGMNTTSNPNSVASTEINTKAVKDFTRTYKNVSDATWFKTEKEFIVFFTRDDISFRVFYTKNGHYEGIIRDYTEDKLPPEIRNLVKSTYYDFNIYHINEVSADGIISYLIKIEGKTSWKTIKVTNDEMEVVEEYSKN